MRGNPAGGAGICCKAWCNVSSVAMPSTGTASVQPGQGQAACVRLLPVLGNGCLSLWRGTGLSQSPGADRSPGPDSVAGSLGTLLAHPERVAEEYQRRLQPERWDAPRPRPRLEAQIGKVRQGVARLIDSYAEGLMEKHEFEPRITRLRQRIARSGGATPTAPR